MVVHPHVLDFREQCSYLLLVHALTRLPGPSSPALYTLSSPLPEPEAVAVPMLYLGALVPLARKTLSLHALRNGAE